MKQAFDFLQHKIDQTGMYRTVTIGLSAIIAGSLILGLVGYSPYTFTEQLWSLLTAVMVALGLNLLIATVTKIPANHESALITALLLFCLFVPAFEPAELYVIALATAVAVGSKFVLTWRKQHLFNAAAFGAVALTFTGWHEAWWWIAQPELWPVIVLAGVAVVEKVRKFAMVGTMIAVGLVVFSLESLLSGQLLTDALWRFLVTGPALFLAFFMLTEPFTTPPTKKLQMMYGALVGGLMSTSMFSGVVAMTPELALVIGNLAFYPFTLKQKLYLKLLEKRSIAADTFEFIFEKPAGMRFKPGQYLEWMLPHKSDGRGPRRYFTIASAPEEETVKLALRVMPEGGSSYKNSLLDFAIGDSLIASQLAGDFLLPADAGRKIAFIGGGIGITPFRAYLGHMFATGEQRDYVLYYANKYAKDIAYQEELKRAETEFGLNWINVLGREELPGYEHGYITEEMIKRCTPDYLERAWYLSGPPGMVNAYEKLLRQMKVPKKHIKTDFFPGLA